MIRWAGHVERGGQGKCLQGCDGGRSPLGRPRRMWQDDSVTMLTEMGWKDLDLINLALDRDGCRNTPEELKL
jgi:hypothetical protein